MVAHLLEGPALGGRGSRAGANGISTTGSAVAFTLDGIGGWGGVSEITDAGLDVDADTSTAASGLSIGVMFLSLVDIFGELGGGLEQ